MEWLGEELGLEGESEATVGVKGFGVVLDVEGGDGACKGEGESELVELGLGLRQLAVKNAGGTGALPGRNRRNRGLVHLGKLLWLL